MLILALDVVIGLIILVNPIAGVIAIFALQYFPLLPNLQLGPFEASISALPTVLLALVAFLRRRGPDSNAKKLEGWQYFLIIGLGVSFILSSINSVSFSTTLGLLPNMALYLLVLYAMQVLVDSERKMIAIAKALLIMAFIRALWEVELLPLRLVLGIPGMGGENGTVFVFHASVALGLVAFLVTPGWFSKRWQLFAIGILGFLILRGIEFQTRSAWIAWFFMLIVLITRVPLNRLMKWSVLALPVLILMLWSFRVVIENNLEQTQNTLSSISGTSDQSMNDDDFIREVGRQSGLAMFRASPLLGVGPGMLMPLKAEFSPYGSLYLKFGTFNAWLTILAENGLLGVSASLLIVLAPLGMSWLQTSKKPNDSTWLAFAFALGVFGFAIHLFFISLMFSFFWMHVGLALAAVRLAYLDRID